jgi:hypothetical protein
MSGSEDRAVGQPDPGGRVRADQDPVHLGAEPQVHAVLTVQLGEDRCHLGAEHGQQRLVFHADHGGGDAGVAGGRGHLEPDPARAHDDHPGRRGQGLAQPVAVVHRAQVLHAVGPGPGHRQQGGRGAGGQQQLVVAEALAGAQRDLAQFPVDGGHAGAEPQVDVVLGVPAVLVHEDRIPFLAAQQVALGQRRALIGVVRFVADEHDLPLETLRAQRFRGSNPSERRPGDHERGSRWHDAASVGSVTTGGSPDTGHLKPAAVDSPGIGPVIVEDLR